MNRCRKVELQFEFTGYHDEHFACHLILDVLAYFSEKTEKTLVCFKQLKVGNYFVLYLTDRSR